MNIKTFTGKVIDKQEKNKEITILSLKCPENFSFKAGQFVSIRLGNDGEQKVRSYSILSPPSKKGKLDLCVGLINGGFASNIFSKTKVGDEFKITGPLGHFTFNNDENEEYWFLGAGTGVVPLFSMLQDNVKKFQNKKFKLIFSVKKKKDLFLVDELTQLQIENSNFEFIPTLTKEEWAGSQGRIQKHIKGIENKTFYICGWKDMVLDIKDFLIKKGVEFKNIKFERFS
jgi:ferredoxin-NADP reductase